MVSREFGVPPRLAPRSAASLASWSMRIRLNTPPTTTSTSTATIATAIQMPRPLRSFRVAFERGLTCGGNWLRAATEEFVDCFGRVRSVHCWPSQRRSRLASVISVCQPGWLSAMCVCPFSNRCPVLDLNRESIQVLPEGDRGMSRKGRKSCARPLLDGDRVPLFLEESPSNRLVVRARTIFATDESNIVFIQSRWDVVESRLQLARQCVAINR